MALSDERVRLLRLRAQRLDPRSSGEAGGVARAVKDICGVQAQDAAAASLAVRARTAELVAGDVERALVRERSVVRTWAMRYTLHLLAAEDLGWLLPLLEPVFARGSRRRRAALGLDEEVTARGVALLRDVLADEGPLTRAEIVERLGTRGLSLGGQAVPHLVGYAALQGVVCHGPERAGKPTYVLLDDWVDRGPALPREEGLAELARRYLAAYGPAGPEDLAAWSGLPLGDARAGWGRVAGEMLEVEVAGRPAWLPRDRAAWLAELPMGSPVVRLAPSFDPYLLGYRGRELAVAPEHARRIHPGGGLLHPALLVDGRAAGTWRSKRRRGGLDVVVEPFAELAAEARQGLAAEVADVGRFLGGPAALELTQPA